MIPAHLVFADINDHSTMPVERRIDALNTFWRICKEHRPSLRRPENSFYETDNDSLMAGFSGVEEMATGPQVIEWAMKLHSALLTNGVSISLGIGLATSPYSEHWESIPGLLPQLKGHLYISDDTPLREGGVDRRRLIGNPLIIVSRLLSLAKKTGTGLSFAFFHDAPGWETIDQIQKTLASLSLPEASLLADKIDLLGDSQSHWMQMAGVVPYGIVLNKAVGTLTKERTNYE